MRTASITQKPTSTTSFKPEYEKVQTSPAQGSQLPLIAFALRGTGSGYDVYSANLALVSEYLHYRTGVEMVGRGQPDVRTAAQHLTNIRSVFGLPMAELGALFRVSRQSIYKWLHGAEPDARKADQIHALSQIADQFKTSGVTRAGAVFKMKAFDGKSLYQLFKDGEQLPRNVSAVIDAARRLEADYDNSALRNSKASPNDEWRSYLSIPGTPERD